MISLAVLFHPTPNVSHPSFLPYLCYTHYRLSHSYLLGYQLTGYQARITEPVLT